MSEMRATFEGGPRDGEEAWIHVPPPLSWGCITLPDMALKTLLCPPDEAYQFAEYDIYVLMWIGQPHDHGEPDRAHYCIQRQAA